MAVATVVHWISTCLCVFSTSLPCVCILGQMSFGKQMVHVTKQVNHLTLTCVMIDNFQPAGIKDCTQTISFIVNCVIQLLIILL